MNIRQGGRRRGRNNGGNNRPQGGNRGGHDSGNRIDNRARGNAAQMIEKYKNLARDAQLSGDRVQTEYYLQFADHYFRVLMDFRARQEENRPQGQDRWQGRERDIEGVENFDGRDDVDPIENDGAGDDADMGDDDGDDRAPRGDDGRRDDRGQRGNRDFRRDRDDRGQRDFRRERNDRSERNDRNDRGDRMERVERSERPDRQEAPRANDVAAEAPRDDEPRGRGRRPRRPAEDDGAAVIDTAALPPAFARPVTADSDDDGEAAPAPKVRRPRRTLAVREPGAEAAE